MLDVAALGLGEATLQSRLNEPLDIEIALVGLKPAAGPPNAAFGTDAMHGAAGITSVEMLRGLRVEVFAEVGRPAYVRITSERAIREPVVSFLLVVESTREHVTREYTVLLDPPGYSLPITTTPGPTPGPVQTARAASAPSPTPLTVHNPESIGPVLTGDTLSRLAMEMRKPAGVTWAQMAWAIYRLNPEAFIGNDINMLKSGVYLNVPTAETASRWSNGEALALIKSNPGPASIAGAPIPDAHDQRGSARVVASQRADDSEAPSNSTTGDSTVEARIMTTEPEPELPQSVFRLLSPESFDSPRTAGSTSLSMSVSEQAQIQQLVANANQQIRDSHEEIERARRQLDDTARQISTLVETVNKKDLEIQGLESRLADLREFVSHQTAAMARPEPPWLQRLLLEAVLLAATVGVLAVTLSQWSETRRQRGGKVDEATIALELPSIVSGPLPPPAETVEQEAESELPENESATSSTVNDDQTIDHAEYEEIEIRGDPLMEVNAYLAYGYPEKARQVLTEFVKENTAHAESRLLMLRVLHTMCEKRTFRRHAEALLELVDGPADERWMEAVRLGRAILPEERLFNADAYKRADDEKWEETVWTGTRPELKDGDDHVYLDIDEFKYVDLFLQDGTEDAIDGSDADPSIDAAAEPEDTEAELARWRAKMLGSTEDRGISLDLDDSGHESANDEQS